ncbi:STE/STE20 protein kinase [Aspergillus sclerotioniger CBS 115572]|uniref:STE/STE20 protein kinase n=1 Tax=Aspergillus sclerotioniger CBS 115572 TaxID=1450535 RepID=A0A317VB36_9EURO|nr:STE/STE20 protein kinase [Aspergillus sclerotioniger CBS 115572]PWY70287.1 STE/STE20 protein kinase [Aspergillus sclerotioniger CBS 115572]
MTTLKLGQSLKGKINTYTITKKLHDSIWLANNLTNQPFIIKNPHQARINNERAVLKQFQTRTPYLRPLIDEIIDPPALVLRHLDDDLMSASASQRLTTSEIKYVSKKVLQALAVLHDDGYVHTVDVKLDNILVNYGSDGQRFTDIQLCDLENTVHVEHKFCKDRECIGAPVWRSPEAQLGLQWGPPTDIWSFGTMVISLIWGDNFFIFKPDVPRGHEEYELKILTKYYVFFGPYPPSYVDLADDETLAILSYVMDNVPAEKRKPFSRAGRQEISVEDREFVCKIMRMDPRDRPTARELLGDKWFQMLPNLRAYA